MNLKNLFEILSRLEIYKCKSFRASHLEHVTSRFKKRNIITENLKHKLITGLDLNVTVALARKLSCYFTAYDFNKTNQQSRAWSVLENDFILLFFEFCSFVYHMYTCFYLWLLLYFLYISADVIIDLNYYLRINKKYIHSYIHTYVHT